MEPTILRLSLLLLLLRSSRSQSPDVNSDSNPIVCSVGGIFSSHATVSEFHSIVKDLSNTNGFPCKSHATATNLNPLAAVMDLCQQLVPRKVVAILLSQAESDELVSSPASAVSFVSSIHSIPVIGISSRGAALSDKNVFPSVVRTAPPYFKQADAWARLLSSLDYRRVVFIHSSDADGRAALGRFQAEAWTMLTAAASPPASPRTSHASADARRMSDEMQMEAVMEFQPGLESFKEELNRMKNLLSRVYVLHSSLADAEVIFRDAAQVMGAEGVVWLVTEGALGAKNAPVGTLGLRLVGASDVSSHLRDGLSALATALGDVGHAESLEQPLDACALPEAGWDAGALLFRSLINVSIDGKTGRVSFDENGDRRYADYDVVNVREGGAEVRVGRYYYSAENDQMELTVEEEKIIWPGYHRNKPPGIVTKTHLNVLTIEEAPFVYVRKVNIDFSGVPMGAETKEERGAPSRRGSSSACDNAGEVPCPRPHDNAGEGESVQDMYCCSGYCIDLLKELSMKADFTYSLSLTPDGQYGSYVMKNATAGERKQWTGMIGEIVAERADMIVAALTINPERSEFIEFSKPFKYQGITILERKPSRSSTLVSFLQPFDNTLWMLVMASVHVVALILCLLDRFSPFSRYMSIPPPPDPSAATGIATKRSSSTTMPTAVKAYTEEDALNLSSAIWFAWGVLLNSGIGEGMPRSLSAKVLGIVWAAFAMMIVASYTANLAAFLVLERPYSKPTGLQDALLLNRFGNLTCATVRGSAVEMFLQRQVELSRLHEDMKALNYDAANQAIQDVKNGKLKAFIWDSSRLELEAAMDCELVTTGELFGQSGYGVGLQKDSPWTTSVTLAILDMHEGGYMESLDKKWFPHLREESPGIQCDGIHPAEKTPTTLGLRNMAGVFILVLAGIFGGVALLVIEVVYKRHHAKAQYRRELARYAFDKWRNVIMKRRYIRAAIASQKMQKQLISNGKTENIPLRTPPPQEFTFGTLIPSSVGNVGSVAAAAANVDLILQMSPRVEHIDSFESFEDIEDGFSDLSNYSD